MSSGLWAGVAALGGLGAVLRLLALARPGGLLGVNLAGALAAGVLVGAAPGPEALVLAGSGLLGALTTFSTWMSHATRDPGPARVAARLTGPLALGLVAAALGRAVGGVL
jgi:CrcB protein